MTNPFKETNERRFIVCCLAIIALFWIAVAVSVPFSLNAPRQMAVQRYSFGFEEQNPSKVYWRYTGERPNPAEALRVTYRQSYRFPNNGIQIQALLGNTDKPTYSDVHYTSNETPSLSYFDIQHVQIPNWPKDRELWIGFQGPPGSRIWLEFGDPGFGNLQYSRVSAYSRKIKKLVVSGDELFSSIDARVVPKNSPPTSPAIPWYILMGFAAIAIVPTTFLKTFRRWWLVFAIFQIALLWKAMEVQFPSQWMWGGYYHDRIGTLGFWLGLCLVQLFSFPGWRRIIGELFKGRKAIGGKLVRRGVPFLLPWVLAVILVPVLASRFHTLPMYGDGYGSLSIPGYDYHNPFATGIFHMVRDGWNYLHTSAFDRDVAGIAAIGSGVSKLLGDGVIRTGELISQAIGDQRNFAYADIDLIRQFVTFHSMFFVVLAGLIAFSLGRTRREKTLFLFLLISAKFMLTFFGYVEIYGPALTVQACLIWLLIRGYRKGGVLLPTAFAFFAYLFQMTGAMAFPAILFLWMREFSRSDTKVKWFLSRVSGTMILAILLWLNCLAVLFVFKHDMDVAKFSNAVPAFETTAFGGIGPINGLPMLYGSTGVPSEVVFFSKGTPNVYHSYTWDSLEHLSQISGEWLFLLGPVLPWLLIFVFTARGRSLKSFERWGFSLATLAFLVSSFFLATSFPYPKDWDVFTIQSLWVLVTMLWFISSAGALRSRAARWVLSALLLYFLWDTTLWVYYNLTWGPPMVAQGFVFF